MRVLINTLTSESAPCGVNRAVAGTIRALADAQTVPALPRGAPTPGDAAVMRAWGGARAVTVRMVWEQFWLPYRCVREGFDLIHAFGVLPAWQALPGVLTVANTFPLDPKLRRETRDGAYRHRMLARSIRAARRVLLPTAAHADAVAAAIPDMPTEKFTVLPFGVDEAFFHPDRTDAVRQELALRYGLPGRFVLHLGPLTPRNNPTHVVQAYFAATVVSSLPHRLVLVGRGHDNRFTLRFIREHGLEDKVRLLPSIPEDDLPALVAMASCLLRPALAAGTGMALLEAMAADTPVIASDLPIHRELCGNGAVLVPPGDLPALRMALERVLTDETHAAELRAAGRERAKAFSWQRHAAELRAVYRDAIG